MELAPPYPALHKSTYSTSESSCVSTENVRGANTKYWSQHHRIPHYTNTPTILQEIHVCPLGMCVVLVRNIGLSTTQSNTTEMRPQHFRKFMCVHWECAWCQYQILVLAPPYTTLHKYAYNTSVNSCVSTGKVRGANGKIGLSTTISNTTQIRPKHLRKFMCVHWECAWCKCQILVLAPPYPTLHKLAHRTLENSCVSTGNVRGATVKHGTQHHHIQHYTNWPTALQKIHVCPLGIYVVLVPNIGLSTAIFNHTQILPQHFKKFMCVHRECAWCYCQTLDLAPPYPTFHKSNYSTLENSYISSGNVRGASTKYWSQHHRIPHYTNTPTILQ